MSDYVATVDALLTRLTSGFTALPIYHPNDDRSPTLEKAKNGFVLTQVRINEESQISLGLEGSRLHRDYGEFTAYIYVPSGSRAGAAWQHAEAIRNLFKSDAVQGVNVTSRTIGGGANVEGPKANSRAFCVPVFVEFFTDRTE